MQQQRIGPRRGFFEGATPPAPVAAPRPRVRFCARCVGVSCVCVISNPVTVPSAPIKLACTFCGTTADVADHGLCLSCTLEQHPIGLRGWPAPVKDPAPSATPEPATERARLVGQLVEMTRHLAIAQLPAGMLVAVQSVARQIAALDAQAGGEREGTK